MPEGSYTVLLFDVVAAIETPEGRDTALDTTEVEGRTSDVKLLFDVVAANSTSDGMDTGLDGTEVEGRTANKGLFFEVVAVDGTPEGLDTGNEEDANVTPGDSDTDLSGREVTGRASSEELLLVHPGKVPTFDVPTACCLRDVGTSITPEGLSTGTGGLETSDEEVVFEALAVIATPED